MIKTNISKVRDLVGVYEDVIKLLRGTADERLENLANHADGSLQQLNKMLANEVDAKTSREMLKGLRQGLREIPKLIATVAPDKFPNLIVDIEKRLEAT